MSRTWMTGVSAVVMLASAIALGQETFNENAADKIQGREGTPGQKGAPLNDGINNDGINTNAGVAAGTNGAGANINAGGANINAGGANVNAGVGNRAAGNAANQWRYRHHNGHWWYYNPNKQWSYFNGNAWSNYSPQGYRQWYYGQYRPYAGNYGYGGYNNYGYNRYNTG